MTSRSCLGAILIGSLTIGAFQSSALAEKKSERAGARIFGSKIGPGVQTIAQYDKSGQSSNGTRTSSSGTSSARGMQSASKQRMRCTPAYGNTQGGEPVTSESFQGTIDGCVLFLQPPSESRPRRQARPSPAQVAAGLLDRARSLAPESDISIAPARIGLTGLTSYFWIESPPQPITAQAQAGPVTVTAEAHPSQYVWRFGDGSQKVTNHPGRPWTRYQPGDIPHLYEARDTYTVSVEVVWEARWRINDGAWQPLGLFSTTSDTDYPVRQILALLARWR